MGIDKAEWFKESGDRCSKSNPITPLMSLPIDRMIVALTKIEEFQIEQGRYMRGGA